MPSDNGFDIVESIKTLLGHIERKEIIVHSGTWTQRPEYKTFLGMLGEYHHVCVGPDELEIRLYVSRPLPPSPPPTGVWFDSCKTQEQEYDDEYAYLD